MIDNERVTHLDKEYLEQLSSMCDEFDCFGIDCSECPFELENPYKVEFPYHVYRCSLAYAKQLYRRLNE